MGLFDSVRGALGGEGGTGASDDPSAGETPRLDVRDPTPMDFRNKAVDAVGEWEAVDLDYSTESLERLDAFARKQGARLDVLRAESDDGGERVADMHTGFTIRSGSYLGEVLVRQFDGEWVEDGDHWAVTVPTGDDARTVDVFEVASHAFAEEPVFVDLAAELGADMGRDDESDTETDDVDLRPDFRPDAEEFAAFWDAYDLDFSAVSLARLDVLVESEWDDGEFDGVEAGGEDMDSKMYTELVKQLGCYYGEVLVRELEAGWTRRDGAVVVVVPGDGGGDVTVPIFDVAEAVLTGREAFAEDVTAVAEDAGRDVPDVPTRDTAESVTDEPLGQPPDGETTDDSSETDARTDDPDGTGVEANESTVDDADRPEALSPADILGMDDTGDTAADDTAVSETSPDSNADGPDEPGAEPEADEGETESGDGGPVSTPTDADVDGASMDDVIPHADTDDAEAGASTDESDTSDLETLDLEDGTDDGGLTPAEIREDAAAFAATWPAHDLDFSPESLERLDALVAEEYPAEDVPEVTLSDGAAASGYLAARVVEAGGYFAEVLRRTVGGRWDEDDGLTFVVSGPAGETRVDPAAVATDCFRGADTFAARYETIRSRLSP